MTLLSTHLLSWTTWSCCFVHKRILYYQLTHWKKKLLIKIGIANTIQARKMYGHSNNSTYSAEFLWDFNDKMCVKYSAVMWETLNKKLISVYIVIFHTFYFGQQSNEIIMSCLFSLSLSFFFLANANYSNERKKKTLFIYFYCNYSPPK